MNHRIASWVFALAVGFGLAWLAYQWGSNPRSGEQRAQEEAVVLSARAGLATMLGAGASFEVVDPLAPNRVAGKVYVYPVADGWEVSGHYRRTEGQAWRPWLMRLDSTREIVSLSVRDDDPETVRRAENDPRLSVSR